MPDSDVLLRPRAQITISRSTAGRMWLIFLCAAMVVIQSAMSDAGASLLVAITTLCCAVLVELLITQVNYQFEKIKDGSAAASALVLALLLPNQIHPLYAGLGAVFAMAVVKYSFGGLGSNWVNPALGGWLFIRCSWPAAFTRAMENTPAGDLPFVYGVSGTGSAADNLIRTFFNDTVLSLFNAEMPSGYLDLLVSQEPGIIADRGVLALLAGTIIITAFQVSRAWIPALFLSVFGMLVWFAGVLPAAGDVQNGDVLFALFSGGTMVAAFILLAEPASGAKSRPGMAVAALAGAVFSWLFRYRGLEFYGCFFALALINALTPMLRSFEGYWLYSRPNAPPRATPSVSFRTPIKTPAADRGAV